MKIPALHSYAKMQTYTGCSVDSNGNLFSSSTDGTYFGNVSSRYIIGIQKDGANQPIIPFLRANGNWSAKVQKVLTTASNEKVYAPADAETNITINVYYIDVK